MIPRGRLQDTYHHTFFEMLGNWSFGDYFKEEAITWAWQLLTEVYGLPKVRWVLLASIVALPTGVRRLACTWVFAAVLLGSIALHPLSPQARRQRAAPAHGSLMERPLTSPTKQHNRMRFTTLGGGIMQDRLYATYFAGDAQFGLPADDEARNIWRRYLPDSRILPFDKKANFWEMGDTGPCGPCSEIHFDRIGGRDAAPMVNRDDPTVIEIWNIVFMQFNREPSGDLRELPAKHIDTGMGFERLTSILQAKMSNYDTDVFAPLFSAIQAITGAEPYTGKLGAEDVGTKDMAYRVIADHARTLTLAITDGAVPSNEGRGYVLRRILRRAVRYGQQMLKAKAGFFSQLVPVVVAAFKDAFPELAAKQAFVQEVIRDEEDSFTRTLSKGIRHFNGIAAGLKAAGSTVVKGEDAFFLYDSMGFPVDLTQIMASEEGLTVDIDGYYKCMAEQRARSQAAGKFTRVGGSLVLEAEQTAWLQRHGIAPTDDSAKYTSQAQPVATVKAIYSSAGFVEGDAAAPADAQALGIVLDVSSFYAESGGQVADTGALTLLGSAAGAGAAAGGDADGAGVGTFEVADVQVYGGYVLHLGAFARDASGAVPTLRVGDRVRCDVDFERRAHVAPNHTMTHVLNYALREVLGPGVDQKGSLVAAERFRFDYSSNAGLDADQLERVTRIVQEKIDAALPVYSQVLPLAAARSINTLRAVFGETYPDPVRVVSVGQDIDAMVKDPENAAWNLVSVELCGGTHVSNTSRAGHFAILEEGSIAKGVRRITAVTREAARAAMDRAAELELDFSMARALSGAALEARCNELKTALNEADVPAHVKARLRNELSELGKRVVAEQKAIAKALEDAGRAAGARIVAEAQAAGRSYAIVDVPEIKADGKAAQVLTRAALDAGIALLATSSDGAKLLVIAAVPAAKQAALKAKDWVAAVMAACDGKGGGRDDAAQGTAKDAPGKAAAVHAAGEAFAVGKL